MAKGSGAGLIRVPNIGTGPLLKITGNNATPNIPGTADTWANGGNNSYQRALMWEAKGLKNWSFYITAPANALATTGGVTIWGTRDQNTVLGLASNWFKIPIDRAPDTATGPQEGNPMIVSGDSFDYDRALYGIAVTVAGYSTGPVNLFVEATG